VVAPAAERDGGGRPNEQEAAETWNNFRPKTLAERITKIATEKEKPGFEK